MAKEKSAIERFAESKFMRKLQEGSQKLASNEIFSTISGGMGATMGLIMVGAVIQMVCAVGAMFGWDTSSASYQAFYMPYKLTMGLMGFFMCFSMAYNYAKRKKMNQMQSVVTALVCYILVVSPPVSASVVAADGTIGRAFDALNLSSLGTGGMFVAFIIPECFQAVLQIFCFYFAFVLRNCDHFMAAVLNGSRLMAGYMAGLCCDHALIRFQHGADHNGICLRTARQEINICLWTFARLPDFLFCTFTVWIRSVSGYFLQICFHKSLKDLFMCSFRIIIFK